MKRKLFLLVFLFLITPVFAQIENEINESKVEQVKKGRDYLLEKFLDRDYDKVKEIKDYLLTFETEDFMAFIPAELWFVMLWTQEYDALLSNLRDIDSDYITELNKKVMPYKGQLINQLYRRSVEDEHILRFNLEEAHLSQEDCDLLSLFLDYALKPNNEENQQQCNATADKFLANYPNSDYEWFVRHEIRVVYGKVDFGMGIGLDLCTGLSTGKFPKPVGGFGFHLDFLYKKFDLMAGAEILYGKTNADVPYAINGVPQIYPKGSESDLFVYYADLSYPIVENKKIRLAPFVGIGGLGSSIPDDKVEGSTLKRQHEYLAYDAGLCFDVKGRLLRDEGALRIKYRFGLAFPDGSVSTVNLISVGWWYDCRWPKRIY